MLPQDTDLKGAYVNGTDDEQKFIQNLAMFLSTFLKEHGHLLEKKVRSYLIYFQSHGFISMRKRLF